MKHCHQHRVAGRGAKALVALVAFIALVGAMLFAQPNQASAQNARIKHVITKQTKQSPQMGRELWFTMIQNYMDQSGKYYQLYVTSPAQTNVYVNMAGQATKVLPVQPLTVASFSIPLGWEIKSSAVVTNNAIHVWSNDGDICAYLMSHNPYTSDGMYIIPKIGWGTTYVVAAYNALFEGFGSYVYDFPSEMAIVADVDNTVVTITPSTDIRVEGSPQACCSCLIHPKGVPFVEILNRGQAIQYQTTCTQNAEDFDFSGTIVTSNVPVGVVAGSTCPNIPMENPYCDHVCDMMAPVRAWAQTYYSAPFYPAAPGKQWSSFMVISSKAHQTIYRMDPNTPAGTPFCTIDAQYGTYLRPDIDQPSRWYSDAPFYLIQYINSATYPDGINGNGDPAEVIINPVEQYTKTVVFQTPTSIGNQSPYLNYVNIISLKNSTKNTTFDGQKISGLPHMAIDGVYEITRVKGVKSGAHIIQSDTGVGVYIYGYGYNESYAWTGSYGTGTFNSPDTIAPDAIPTGSCFYAHVALSDSGLSQSKLNEIRIDSVYNMAYNQDDPKWIEGVGIPSSYYDMFVLDSTKEAYLKISVFDVAGNLTTIVSTYVPQTARIAPPIRDFGVGNIGGAPVYQYDTIVNTGSVPFVFTDLKLALGQGISGFALDSAVTTPLGVGETRIFKLSFVPQKPTASYDTIIFGDPCILSLIHI